MSRDVAFWAFVVAFSMVPVILAALTPIYAHMLTPKSE